MKKISEEYINDLNNARYKEEYHRIRKEYKERVKFELGKLTEQEIKEFERKASWEEYKEAKDIENRVKEAERKAKEYIIDGKPDPLKIKPRPNFLKIQSHYDD
ncbi:MAG: hypothetical protein IIX02_04855 [Clostridia bacterium]|nr:hypothetical protein [Clostridia bacterium]